MDWTEILVELIKIGIPTLATTVVGKKIRKQANKHSARNSILLLIQEDKFRFEVEHILPENYQNVLAEYDEYQQNGGNSYIKQKVSDYVEWYGKINKRKESK